MAVGQKYRNLLRSIEAADGGNGGRFLRYAKKCKADFYVIDSVPDNNNYRCILEQKLLIPNLFKNYDEVLFLDLDIYINPEAPSLFDLIPADKALGAVLSPRGQDRYKKAWAKHPQVLSETVKDYFELRGFPWQENLLGDINGGVLFFRPEFLADDLLRYYFSDHKQSPRNGYEEAPMAFYSQSKNLFCPLDEMWNSQFLYTWVERKEGIKSINGFFSNPLTFLKAKSKGRGWKESLLLAEQTAVLNQMKKNSWIIHLSGGYDPYLLEASW